MDGAYSSFTSQETRHLIEKRRKECITARRVLVILAFFGFFNTYALQVTVDAGMSRMINWTAESDLDNSPDQCSNPARGNVSNEFHKGELNWDTRTQDLVSGSFFYGYVVTQVPGGWLASRVGGKKLFGWAVFITAALNLLTPVVAKFHLYLFIAVRVLEGLSEGMIYPAAHSLWGFWAPKGERSRLTTLSYAGAVMGGSVTWAVGGILTDSGFLGGWPSIFYVFGITACIWFFVWMFSVHDTPADHPRISKEEKEHIEESVGRKQTKPIPWKSILKSPPVWAICIAQFCAFWTFYNMVIGVPVFLKVIHNIDIRMDGLYTSLPYLVLFITVIVVGHLADYIQGQGCLSTTNTRKMMTTAGLLVPASSLIACAYVGCMEWAVITLLMVSVVFFGFVYGGFFVNHLDIAPRFAGVLMGLSTTTGTIPAIIVPVFMDYLLHFSNTISTWQAIFLVNGCVCIIGCGIYNAFCTGEEQTWALPDKESDRDRRNRRVDNWFVDSTDLS